MIPLGCVSIRHDVRLGGELCHQISVFVGREALESYYGIFVIDIMKVLKKHPLSQIGFAIVDGQGVVAINVTIPSSISIPDEEEFILFFLEALKNSGLVPEPKCSGKRVRKPTLQLIR